MLLTESEQFKHISALLYRVTSKGRGSGEGVPPKKESFAQWKLSWQDIYFQRLWLGFDTSFI